MVRLGGLKPRSMFVPYSLRLLCLTLCCLAGTCGATETALPKIDANDNRVPAGQMNANVLTLRLELRKGQWFPRGETDPSYEVFSFAEEGKPLQTPGPMIRVPQKSRVHVSVHNSLLTTVYVHGLHEHPNKTDDVMELQSGQTKDADFSAGEPGSYFYWASCQKGGLEARPPEEGMMSGAFIVDASGVSSSDRVFMIQLWDKDLFHPTFEGALSINGKSWPYTEKLHAQIGRAEHWRILNPTPLLHPMHLHGFYFHVDGVGDGETARAYSDSDRRMAVTEVVNPGHTFDMTWTPERSGNWLFHCHLLDHMSDYKAPWLYGPGGAPPKPQPIHMSGHSSDMGMGDLVMGITVTDPDPKLADAKATMPNATAHKDLYVRHRDAMPYVPAGAGFYLDGVSKSVEPAGPPLIVSRGETTAITVHNEMDEPTAIHWHGIEIESYYDGVPGWNGTPQRTTPYIAPQESFVAYMTPPRAGTFIYHTHWHNVKQLTGGLYGALLVIEPGQKYDPATDKVFLIGRGGANEMQDPLVLNGSPQPALMVLLTGQSYRFRFVNITPEDPLVTASLLVDGKPVKWKAIAKDGADLPPQQATLRDSSQGISVGETYDFQFSPEMPGNYVLRFCSEIGTEVTQPITVVPPNTPFSVFAKR